MSLGLIFCEIEEKKSRWFERFAVAKDRFFCEAEENKLRWVPVGKDSPPIGTSAKCKLHLRPSFDF